MMLRIDIVDSYCNEGEAHQLFVPVDTDKISIMSAIEILYPSATYILLEVEEVV